MLYINNKLTPQLQKTVYGVCIYALQSTHLGSSDYCTHESIVTYLNTDHHSFAHNFSSCKIIAWKKNQAWTGFEPMTSATPVQYSARAGHIVSS